MYIKNNSFLQPTYKNIRPYECSMVVVDGPNTVGKISMQGMEIPYDSFFVSKMTMTSGATNKPVSYGFMGNDVTYILIKVQYDDGSKVRCSDLQKKDFYIEYFFSDNPNDVRPIGQIMILTSGANKRIPQLYLNNPMDFPVVVEIMVASADANLSIGSGMVNTAFIDGLYYNSVITDFVASGSTQFEIINEQNDVLLVLPIEYFMQDENIQNIKQDDNILTVTTENNEKIILKFLSVYDANQAHSRFNWIFEDPTHRYLTKDYPEPDLVAPVISINIYADDNFNSSGITKEDLRTYYITGVNDSRDGVIDVSDVNVIIRRQNNLVTIDEIVEEGIYDIIFRVKDIASNEASVLRTAKFDMTPPIIEFNVAAGGSTINMTISSDSQIVPSQGLTESDVLRYCVSRVTDNIDGEIAKSAVTLQVSGVSFPISVGGDFPIDFIVSDSCGNITNASGKTLHVIDDIPPILSDVEMFSNPIGFTGNIIDNYTLLTDNDSGTTYNIQLSNGVTKDKDLAVGLMGFYLISYTLSGGGSLIDYYNNNYTSGQTLDYYIELANGTNPVFYISRSGSTDEYMYDGMDWNVNSLLNDWKIRGDFPDGEYYINGEITDVNGNTNTVTIILNVM